MSARVRSTLSLSAAGPVWAAVVSLKSGREPLLWFESSCAVTSPPGGSGVPTWSIALLCEMKE